MIQTFKNMIAACGSKKGLMQIALTLSALVAIMQGIAYALLFPLFGALVSGSESAWTYLIIIGVLTVLEAMTRLLGSHTETRVYLEVADETRGRLGEQLKQMPLEALTSRRAGDLNQVLTGNVQEVVSIAGSAYGLITNTIFAPTVTIIAMFFIDWRVALAMIVIFPMAIPLYRTLRAISSRANRQSAIAHAETASQIIEYTQGLAVLRATRQVGAKSSRLHDSIEHLRAVQAKANEIGTWPSILVSAVVQLGIVAVTMLAVYFTFEGSYAIAAVAALIVATIRFSEPLALFSNMTAMFDFMEAGINRIQELMSVKPLNIESDGGEVESTHVTFEDVTFSYAETETPVLRNLTCDFPVNSMTALVGSSGSGKTTITKLIGRYADPQTGVVKIGGVDIRAMSSTQLMSYISVVFQDVYLFDDSILENIRIAKPDATDEEVAAAARAANCHDFITRLPRGYDTGVGEIGSALSGGERQRISIARAILKDAPIVILDEPTSALDTESEVAVQTAIDILVKNKTVIVIAHRLSTIVAADNILVLEEGALVEQGKHQDLLDKNGRYAQLWQAQQSARQWKITA